MAFIYSQKQHSDPNTFISKPAKWALFDLDWTLIRPTTTVNRPTLKGGPFCLYEDDWKLIPGRITRLYDFIRENFTIGIITNQKFSNLAIIKKRIESIWSEISQHFPVTIFYCTDDSSYRKPGIGWSKHIQFSPGSLYCGDACNDVNKPDRSWGYNNSDLEFATNMGLPFYSPEEVFPQLTIPLEIKQPIVVLLVGCPGCGKTTFAKKFTGFYHIESDVYKSNWKRVEKVYRDKLQQGVGIILDATNPTRERRQTIIKIANEYNMQTVIIMFLNYGKWDHKRSEGVAEPIGRKSR